LTKPQDLGISKLPDALIKRILNETNLLSRVLESVNDKVDRALKRAGQSSKGKLLGIKKLDDAAFAGSKNKAAACTLILTEGDSAKALAVAGVSSLPNKVHFCGSFFRHRLLKNMHPTWPTKTS